jgi:hypothetical protein
MGSVPAADYRKHVRALGEDHLANFPDGSPGDGYSCSR